MTIVDAVAVADHQRQAQQFLAAARQYLANGDLHQASEKGWGAASHMAKAVAEARGWKYETHSQFHVVLSKAAKLTSNDHLRVLGAVANQLHGNFYRRKQFLAANDIRNDLDHVAELVELLGLLSVSSR